MSIAYTQDVAAKAGHIDQSKVPNVEKAISLQHSMSKSPKLDSSSSLLDNPYLQQKSSNAVAMQNKRPNIV
jgi:hypothetical protein